MISFNAQGMRSDLHFDLLTIRVVMFTYSKRTGIPSIFMLNGALHYSNNPSSTHSISPPPHHEARTTNFSYVRMG